LIPKEGQANECITSPDVIINLTCVSSGKITCINSLLPLEDYILKYKS